MSYFEIKKQEIWLFVKAQPGSQQNSISGIRNDELLIRLKAQPEKGKANDELIKFLSKTLGLTRAEIRLVRGDTARHKTMALPLEALDKIKAIGENP
ncbi:MAG: DUF167 domain-containing protein [Spirochaetales bacterium]|nr:DUF167 domain-containing protein [Spirochaetales bacterium]